MTIKRAVFRCDATNGFGHVSRSVALAEALAEYDVSSVFIGKFPSVVHGWINAIGTIIDAGEADVLSAVRSQVDPHTMLIVDAYEADEHVLRAFSEITEQLAYIDDLGQLPTYPVRCVLNFCARAEAIQYPCTSLRGPRYSLLRRSIRKQQRRKREGMSNALVAIGGRDEFAISALIVASLASSSFDGQVRVICTQASRSLNALRALTDRRVEVVVDADGLGSHLAWADFGVLGGGLTKYEAAFMGVPSIVYAQSAVEHDDVGYFARHGLLVDAGLASEFDGGALCNHVLRIMKGSVDEAARDELFGVDPTRNAAERLMVELLK